MRPPFFRIIAGQFKGARLAIPPPDITRPAKDNVKEAVFNRLSLARKEGEALLLPGARVLDVFAGSGSMGFEALSRGAAHVYMVDNHASVLSVLQHNTQKLRAQSQVTLLAQDVFALGQAPQVMDLVFVDPPYFKGLLGPALEILAARGWVGPQTVIVAEVDKSEEPALPKGFALIDTRAYGRVKICWMFFK